MDTWLTAAHIPGSADSLADKESRFFDNQDTGLKLNPKLLNEALNILTFKPDIDLFGSRINTQSTTYCSYSFDPEATVIDAFSISWANVKFYCFQYCFYSFIASIVVPDWPTQPWYPFLAPLYLNPPVVQHPSSRLLMLCHFPEMKTIFTKS